MTRSSEKKCMEPPSGDSSGFTIGETLRESVWQASEQGRLTFGVHECAQLLEIDPFNTMLCILPDSPNGLGDVSVHIKHTLIEAFCTEYDIRVIKVDSADKLTKAVLGRNEAVDNANAGMTKRPVTTVTPPTGVECLLIQYPDDSPSKEDETLAEYHKASLFAEDSLHSGVISLPD